VDGISDDDFRAGDDYARRLREALGTSAAVLAVFVRDRQIFLGTDGLPVLLDGVRQIPVLEGFCRYIRDSGRQLIVDDARREIGIATHPLVVALDVQAYAGWHVPGEDGRPIGLLCALDDRPRQWSSAELTMLMELAHECGPTVRAVSARGQRGTAA
jgi:GAF domain-containing protein